MIVLTLHQTGRTTVSFSLPCIFSGFLLCLNKTAFHTVASICASGVSCIRPIILTIIRPDRPRQIHYIHHSSECSIWGVLEICFRRLSDICCSVTDWNPIRRLSLCHANESFSKSLLTVWSQTPLQEFSFVPSFARAALAVK